MDHSSLIDSSILIGVRVGFFFATRKFLSSTLNPTLRDLSTESPNDSLPLAITADDSDESYPTTPAVTTSETIELHAVNAKLVRKPSRILLSHGNGRDTTKAVKNETRGLNRAAR